MYASGDAAPLYAADTLGAAPYVLLQDAACEYALPPPGAARLGDSASADAIA